MFNNSSSRRRRRSSKMPPALPSSRPSYVVFVLTIGFIVIFGASITFAFLEDSLHFVSFKSHVARLSAGSSSAIQTTAAENEASRRREITGYISSMSIEDIKDMVSHVKAAARNANVRVIDLPDEFDPERLVRLYPECSKWQWSNEYQFPRVLKQQYVAKPEGPDWCIVPFMAKCWFNMVAKYKLAAMAEAASKVVEALRSDSDLQRTCPPRKQVWIFASGIGPTILGPDWSSIISGNETVLLLAEGDQLGGFYKAHKDIIIPATPKLKSSYHGGRRKLLALFRGSIELHLRDSEGREVRRTNILRQALIDNLGEVPFLSATDVVVGQSSPSYETEMKDSIFCFIPRGNTPWTRRMFDAIVSGCIPVVLSNAIVFPFESLLDWSQFSLKLPESYVVTKPEEMIALLRTIVQNPQLIGHLRNNLEVVSQMLSGQKEGIDLDTFTPLEGILYHLTEHVRGVWSETGNAAKQVGASYHAGAIPHPLPSMLWSHIHV